MKKENRKKNTKAEKKNESSNRNRKAKEARHNGPGPIGCQSRVITSGGERRERLLPQNAANKIRPKPRSLRPLVSTWAK